MTFTISEEHVTTVRWSIYDGDRLVTTFQGFNESYRLDVTKTYTVVVECVNVTGSRTRAFRVSGSLETSASGGEGQLNATYTPTPTPTSTPTPTPTNTPTSTPTDTLTSTPTDTPSPTLTATVVEVTQATPTVASPTPSETLTPTLLPVPIQTLPPGQTCVAGCPEVLVYHTFITGDWEIFRLDAPFENQTNSTNLSHGVGQGITDAYPSLSPNKQWMAFSSLRDGNWEVYIASTDGDPSKLQRITYNTVARDIDPVWGPNNFVVFESTRSGAWDLFLLDVTTGSVRQLTEESGNNQDAYWSPDGTHIVFSSDREGLWQVYEMNVFSLETRRLTDGVADEVDPQVSFDGTYVSYRSYRNGHSVIYLMNPDGSNPRPITDENADATNVSWSPNSQLLAYQSNLDGDLDIYVYELATGLTRHLTDNTIDDYAPTWRCDSETVVFTSDITGNPDVFEAPARPITDPPILVEQDATQLTFDPVFDIYPLGLNADESASREGQHASISLGRQTVFFNPDMTLTDPDPSDEIGRIDYVPIDGCQTE